MNKFTFYWNSNWIHFGKKMSPISNRFSDLCSHNAMPAIYHIQHVEWWRESDLNMNKMIIHQIILLIERKYLIRVMIARRLFTFGKWLRCGMRNRAFLYEHAAKNFRASKIVFSFQIKHKCFVLLIILEHLQLIVTVFFFTLSKTWINIPNKC